MDGDSNDETATESLNGETKPDPAKLAQTAIIKQDVMLSATTTQSPLATVSSVFSMPSVSMGSNAGLNFADHLFMSGISSADSAKDLSMDHNGGIGSLSTPTQLFGQPQVAAPQFFLTSHGLQNQAAGAASLPVQQLLIPVSTGNGTQQFISIPVSLATTGGNQQIQLLTTSNGQIVATNLASIPGLSNPLGFNLTTSGSQSLLNSGSSSGHHSSSSQAQLTNHLAAAIPSLLAAGAQNQLLGLSSQVLASTTNLSHVTSSSASSHSTQSSNHMTHSTNHTQAGQSLVTGMQHSSHSTQSASRITTHSHNSTSIDGLPPNVSQLLPNTVGNSTESTTVDGINLDEIKEFAKQFKIRRLSLGLTQTQVGQALSATEGPAYSQSAICRFEKLDITPKSAQKIKPVLERWMQEAEERYKNGVQNLTDFIGSEPSKKRKRRTSFTPQALEILNQFFERNTHPSGAEMTELADKLNYDREVIRVWFCNKRQALKNTIKKLKQETP
ncbi:hypothetical protein CHS0354_017485 [Potamilus streckersoni]|uniref:POU domain protein n=1 Tax=Potamilus streckersoni TaxID=2493646 RepID=A0AAE0SY95_9BIVA|nr:hypothetical protein CHS0354_017485 [Potamilus streckersoni]